MSIGPVLRKLMELLKEAKVEVADYDAHWSPAANVDPRQIYEAFKKLAYIKFDCLGYEDVVVPGYEKKCECLDWDDGGILFSCGYYPSSMYVPKEEFSVRFRRAFYITLLCRGTGPEGNEAETEEPFTYREIITCELHYEPNELLKTLEADELLSPPYEKQDLNLYFSEIERLDAFRILTETYKPFRMQLYASD